MTETIEPRPVDAEPKTVDPCADIIPYETFSITARETLARGSGALVILLVPTDVMGALVERLAGDMRRRDLLSRYGPTHLILLAPGLSAADARAAVQTSIDSLGEHSGTIAIGAVDVAEAMDPGEFDALVARANVALAEDLVGQSTRSERSLILIADEDADIQQIVDARLQAAGYRTLIAFDGEQALEMAAKHAPDLLLLDLMLPKLTGFDVLARLKELAGDNPRTIVISARDRDEDVTRAFDLGADDYVSKPFNPDELVARIARLLK